MRSRYQGFGLTWMPVLAGALRSLDELSEERSNLEKAFRWEWDNDDILKGRLPPGANPNQAFRQGLKRSALLACFYDEPNSACTLV